MLDDPTQPKNKKTPRLEYLGVMVEADPAGRRIAIMFEDRFKPIQG